METGPLHRRWTFTVRAQLDPKEQMGITGSCSALGDWLSSLIKPLSEESTNLWTTTLELPMNDDVQYRYCVCTFLQDGAGPIIHRYEAKGEPRLISKESTECHEDVYNNNNEERGFLTTETCIQLRVLGTTPFDNMLLRVTLAQSGNESVTYQNIMVYDDVTSKFVFQHQGIQINAGKTAIFEISFVSQEFPIIKLELLKIFDNESNLISSINIAGSTFLKTLDVIHAVMENRDNGSIIGTLEVNYMVIKPHLNAAHNLMLSKDWKLDRVGLYIGHRGCGDSFKSHGASNVRENTLASCRLAAAAKADYIEVDIRLTKDKIPVVYHDASFLLEKVDKGKEPSKIEIEVDRTTLHDIASSEIFHLSEMNNRKKFKTLRDDNPFPTLERLLCDKELPTSVGLNLELKRTMQVEPNQFVDQILNTVQKHVGQREILYSSFDPDIVTMLRKKQIHHGVLLLVMPDSSPSVDNRVLTTAAGISLAKLTSILGLCLNSLNIFNDARLVKQIKNQVLVLFCWGEENNKKPMRDKLVDLGVNGIILDNIHLVNQEDSPDIEPDSSHVESSEPHEYDTSCDDTKPDPSAGDKPNSSTAVSKKVNTKLKQHEGNAFSKFFSVQRHNINKVDGEHIRKTASKIWNTMTEEEKQSYAEMEIEIAVKSKRKKKRH